MVELGGAERARPGGVVWTFAAAEDAALRDGEALSRESVRAFAGWEWTV